MVTSGTYGFQSTANDDWLAESFSRLQIRGDQITSDKITDANRSANLMLAEWNNKGQNQFQLQESTIPLASVTGIGSGGANPGNIIASYFGPATLQIFSSIIVVNQTPGAPLSGFSIPMIRLGRADYEVIPFKLNTGRPDRYFWDTSGLSIAANNMQLWPVPDNVGTYAIRAWTFQAPQDAGSLVNLAPVKYEWVDAFCSGLTARLAEKYAPDQYDKKTAQAENAWRLAVSGGRERGPSRFRVDGRSATSWR